MATTIAKHVDLRVSWLTRLGASPKALLSLLVTIGISLPFFYTTIHVMSGTAAKLAAPTFFVGLLGLWAMLQAQSLRLWWHAKKRLVWLPLTMLLTGVFAQVILAAVWFALSFELNLDFASGSGSGSGFGFLGHGC